MQETTIGRFAKNTCLMLHWYDVTRKISVVENIRGTKEKGVRIIYATNLHEHPVRHFSHVLDIHPSSRENWKGWRSHECAVEFRELLNEPSSRKPLITKGRGARAGAGKEKPIFGEGSKPQISREKLSGAAAALHLHYFLKIDCIVRLVRARSENHGAEREN